MAAESLQEAVQRLNARFPNGVEAGALVLLVEEVTVVLREEVQRVQKLLDAEVKLRQNIEAAKDAQTEHVANLLLVKDSLEEKVHRLESKLKANEDRGDNWKEECAKSRAKAHLYRTALVPLLGLAKAVYPSIVPNMTAAIAIETAERALHE